MDGLSADSAERKDILVFPVLLQRAGETENPYQTMLYPCNILPVGSALRRYVIQ